MAGTGWGELQRDELGQITIILLHGSLSLAELDLPSMANPSAVTLKGERISFEASGTGSIRLQGSADLVAGAILAIHP
ncbi:MAG: hypothetical protein WKF81_14620 [Thermomicrobiales bacterium]